MTKKKQVEKVVMKGFKGFAPGLICEPDGPKSHKQYAENTVFQETEAKVCKKGMHFCEHPLDVFAHYSPANNNGNLNEFAEVEALDECKTDDKHKFTTTKLKIGAKISPAMMAKAAVDFVLARVTETKAAGEDNSAATNTGFQSAATNTGDYSVATNTGARSAAINTGNYSVATNTGNYSVATNTGLHGFAINTGIEGRARGAKGSYIALAEWKQDKTGNWTVKSFKTTRVDGNKIKADVFYTLLGGKFVEVK